MKIISLNTWSARAGKEKLLSFFFKHADVDIFCLQEVWEGGHDHAPLWGGESDTNMITNISKVLTGHKVLFSPYYMDWYGLAIFIKKRIQIKNEGNVFVHKTKEDAFNLNDVAGHARNLQYVTVETHLGTRTILNFHGLWNGQGKGDTPERLFQSDSIIRFTKNIHNPYVLCGDFNLLPETQSLKILKDAAMRDLIEEFRIPSTRSSFYKKPVPFADYTFVSNGIKVNDFKVLPEEVSDHLAMYLDFE